MTPNRTSMYTGMVKVVGVDLQCFPVDPKTLEPKSCGCYDPWAWTDPDPTPVETIHIHEWWARRQARELRRTA